MRALLLASLLFLSACGGGDPEDELEVQYVPPNGPPSVICTPTDTGMDCREARL